MSMLLQTKQLIRINNNVLCQLRDAIQWKWPQPWATGDWQLHHDNVPTHASCFMQSILAKDQITQVAQPLYSPDLVPCDFWLFPNLELPFKGKRFHIIYEDHKHMTGQLIAIPTKDFAECFEQWKRCWENCVRSEGAYSEGVIVLCTMFLVSSSINAYFSHYMAGYFPDRPHAHE